MLWYDWIMIILLIIGGLNWGLYGVFHHFNLVNSIFVTPIVQDIIYFLVGASAIGSLIKFFTK